ncbi:recombinase family protein [Pseudoalteromonas undina]|uniref:Recombinase family protein n=1 Tax=Pseudoalteromonas undina TaxID=43660 RepID=A0ACC6R1P7_9GAMM
MALIGYARVSTQEQDLESQVDALEEYGCQKIFSGKQSGNSLDNVKKLEDLLDYIREGDVVCVTKLDRLGRSLKGIMTAIDNIHSKGAALTTLDGVINSADDSPFGKAILHVIAVFAELNKSLIIKNTAEGRERAIAQGRHMGRPKTISDSDREKIRKLVQTKQKSQNQLSKDYGVSRTTIKRIVEGG